MSTGPFLNLAACWKSKILTDRRESVQRDKSDLEMRQSPPSAVSAAQTVGTRSANDNGISTSNGATISIKSGGSGTFATPWHDSTGYFEATLTQPSPLAFMALFGYNSVPVVARAVAGTPGGSNENCITVLGTTGTLGAGASGGDSTVWLQGSFQVNGPKCGMQIDGTGSDTLHYNGSGGSTSLAYIG